MPLLTYFNNMWYGSASGAMEDTTPTVEVEASIKGTLTGEVQVLAGQIPPYLKGTMGRKQTLLVEGIGELELALPKKIGTIALDVSIGATPSAYDIAQAIWGALAEQYNQTGTMGNKVNSAGAAGNPWTDTADYAPGTKGNDIKLIKTLGLYVAGDK